MSRIVRCIALGIIAPCLYLATVGLALVDGAHASPVSHDRQCFSARQWGPVADRYRPCASVRRIAPHTVRYSVSDAGGTVRYWGTETVPAGAVRIVRLYEDGSFVANVGGFGFSVGAQDR